MLESQQICFAVFKVILTVIYYIFIVTYAYFIKTFLNFPEAAVSCGRLVFLLTNNLCNNRSEWLRYSLYRVACCEPVGMQAPPEMFEGRGGMEPGVTNAHFICLGTIGQRGE